MSSLPTLGPRGEGWVAGQFVLFAAIIFAASNFGSSLAGPALDIVRVAGAALIFTGILVIGLGSWQLQRALSVMPRPVRGGTLVQRGLYGHVRHPIYVGVIMAGIGGSVYSVSLLAAAFAVALAVWMDLKARREEAWLTERYPGYAEYSGRTKRFVPGIY